MGFEPMTPCLPGKYSSQLSYSPKFVSLSWPSHYAAGMSPHCAVLALLPEGCLDFGMIKGIEPNLTPVVTIPNLRSRTSAAGVVPSTLYHNGCFEPSRHRVINPVLYLRMFYHFCSGGWIRTHRPQGLWALRADHCSTPQYIFYFLSINVRGKGLEPSRP